jgi:hypothetical protein
MKKCLTIIDARILNSVAVVFALSLNLGLSGCSSSGEDDASLEVTEPVEATPQESADNTGQAPAAGNVSAGASGTPPVQPETAPSSAAAVPQQPESQGSGTMMNTSRRVLYVKVDTAVLREQADAKAKVVGKANRGDHFLVSIEGDWAKTEDGKYISMKVLSERGVGRQKKLADWGQAQSQPEKPKKKRAKKATSSKEVAPAPAETATSPDAAKTPAGDSSSETGSSQPQAPAAESK